MLTEDIPFAEIRKRLRTYGSDLQWSIVSDAYPASMRRPQPSAVRSSRNGRHFRYDLIHPVGRPDEPPGRSFPHFLEAAHSAGSIAATLAASERSEELPLHPFVREAVNPENLADAWIWLVHDFCWKGLIPTEAVVHWGIYSDNCTHTVGRSDIHCPISVPCEEALLLIERMYGQLGTRLPLPSRPGFLYPLSSAPSAVRKGRAAGLIEVDSIAPPPRDSREEIRRPWNFRRSLHAKSEMWAIPAMRDDDEEALRDSAEHYDRDLYPWRVLNLSADGKSIFHDDCPDEVLPLPPVLREWVKRLFEGNGVIKADDPWLIAKRKATKLKSLRSQLSKLTKEMKKFDDGLAVKQREGSVCFSCYGLAEELAAEEEANLSS